MSGIDSVKTAATTVPSKKQVEWQKTEFYAFAHFGINTYTNREWGTGKEDPAIFNPVNFDAEQWIKAIKSAGMKGIILTAKHHDGFCLWQTKYTDHSVKSSPWKCGKGDVVKEVSDAARKHGIKFGVYLSPWDRHERTYGDSDKYNEYYKNQLTELCTDYGELFSLWFDGACGEGQNGKKQVYDWDGYMEICHKYQPNAVTFNIGDIRWCGNEAGHCRKAEWSPLPSSVADIDVVLSTAQKEEDLDGSFRKRVLSVTESDLGSREMIKGWEKFIWYPCETDTSIRPGWFYHAEEDDRVRSLDELMNIYYNSVGGNSTLLLNIPPDKNGLFHVNDVKRLHEIGNELKKVFNYNYTQNIKNISVSDEKTGFEIKNALKSNTDTDIYSSYFTTSADDFIKDIVIEIEFDKSVELSKIVLMENITIGQRIETFTVEVFDFELHEYIEIYKGETVGYKKIVNIGESKINAEKIKITVNSSRLNPTLAFLGIY